MQMLLFIVLVQPVICLIILQHYDWLIDCVGV